jgi:sugar phosphate isomerase/epimerase
MAGMFTVVVVFHDGKRIDAPDKQPGPYGRIRTVWWLTQIKAVLIIKQAKSYMKKLKIGCGEWGMRELPIEKHFEIAGKFGFKTLEFGIGGDQAGRLPAEIDDRQIAAFRHLGEETGIATPGCCLENDFTLPDAAAHNSILAETLRQIRLAKRCGAEQVRLFAGFTPIGDLTQAIWDRLIAAFESTDALCRELGLAIAIETHGKITMRDGVAHHEHTVSTDPEALARLIDELPPTVGFNWDPGNLKPVSPDDRTCALGLLNERITYCHLKDWRRVGEGWVACAIGDDDLDYAPLLSKVDFDGVFLIEYEPTEDLVAGIERSLAYLRNLGFELLFA